jgi:hypothetical protein
MRQPRQRGWKDGECQSRRRSRTPSPGPSSGNHVGRPRLSS